MESALAIDSQGKQIRHGCEAREVHSAGGQVLQRALRGLGSDPRAGIVGCGQAVDEETAGVGVDVDPRRARAFALRIRGLAPLGQGALSVAT
jgi:hypothetical protein